MSANQTTYDITFKAAGVPPQVYLPPMSYPLQVAKNVTQAQINALVAAGNYDIKITATYQAQPTQTPPASSTPPPASSTGTVQPPSTPTTPSSSSYRFTRLHGYLFRGHNTLFTWGMRTRRKFVGAALHERLHPLI